MIRRIGALVAATALATIAVGTVPTGAVAAGTIEATRISVVNDGTAARGTTIAIVCSVQVVSPPVGSPPVVVSTAELGFDAQGAPTTKSGDMSPYWSADGNSWVSVGLTSSALGRTTCAHYAIDNGGADSTTWTCDYTPVPAPAPSGIGCSAVSGSGRGPVVLNWALDSDGLTSETVNMVFTNTYPASATPRYTG
ncbi:MAG: hypothetical protein FGM58_09475 [Acidimicrobiia bacterium]|nr:hypothetical protein [Acidimicrobiia bacterium]